MNHYEIIIYWSDQDQAFLAEAPELPGCMAHGNSYDQALQNIQEAMQLWLEVAREQGKTIPVPKGRRLLYA